MQRDLHKLVFCLLKDVSTRPRTLDWLEAAVRKNTSRARLHYEEGKVASSGFMSNLLATLQAFSSKIMLGTVDPAYPHHPASRASARDETLIKATKQQVDKWIEELTESGQLSPNPKFPTECFHLTAQCMHLTVNPSFRRFENLCGEIRHGERFLEDIAANLSRGSDMQLQDKLRDKIENWRQERAVIEMAVFNESLLKQHLSFYVKLAQWVSSTATASSEGKMEVDGFKLKEDFPMSFASLPEYYISDLADFIINSARYNLKAIDDPSLHDVITAFTVFIAARNESYVQNPYLVAKCVEALFILTPPDKPKGGVPLPLLEKFRDMIVANR